MGRKALVLGLVAACTVPTVSACSNNDATVTLGPAKASHVQSLPIPAQAQLQKLQSHVAEGYYLLPPGVSLNALNNWYRKHLSAGEPWHDWSPCQLHLKGPGTVQFGWKRGSSFLDLSTSEEGNGQVRVIVVEEDDPASVHLSC